ncbi:hypothetical protein Bca4012_010140 [Brassica carinata]
MWGTQSIQVCTIAFSSWRKQEHVNLYIPKPKKQLNLDYVCMYILRKSIHRNTHIYS